MDTSSRKKTKSEARRAGVFEACEGPHDIVRPWYCTLERVWFRVVQTLRDEELTQIQCDT
jgi:hypothetical protein